MMEQSPDRRTDDLSRHHDWILLDSIGFHRRERRRAPHRDEEVQTRAAVPAVSGAGGADPGSDTTHDPIARHKQRRPNAGETTHRPAYSLSRALRNLGSGANTPFLKEHVLGLLI